MKEFKVAVCRAEEVRAQIEGNVKGMKKEAGQQLRELQVTLYPYLVAFAAHLL